MTTRAYGAHAPDKPLEPIAIERREQGPRDVQIDIAYCGVCHSDLHTARDEWRAVMPTVYPCVPGHEIVGHVSAVGGEVTKFREGDTVGPLHDAAEARRHAVPRWRARARAPLAERRGADLQAEGDRRLDGRRHPGDAGDARFLRRARDRRPHRDDPGRPDRRGLQANAAERREVPLRDRHRLDGGVGKEAA